MAEHAVKAFTFSLAASQRIRKRNADQECEARLDGIVQAHAGPLDMGLVERQKLPDGIVRKGMSNMRKSKDFAHHQQHDKAAVSIDSDIPLLLADGFSSAAQILGLTNTLHIGAH